MLRDEQRPAFNEPWQAEAYAVVQVLIETSRISQAFGTSLREAAAEGEPDSSDTYYAALRRLSSECWSPEGAFNVPRSGNGSTTGAPRIIAHYTACP